MTNGTLTARRQQILSIVGMAMIWPSIHNQVLYPLTFSFHKEGADSPYLYYVLYSVIMLVAIVAILLMGRKGITRRLFSSPAAMVSFGIMGAIGIVLLVVCDFGDYLAQWFMGIGVAFSAIFVPVFFMFWSIQLEYASQKRAAFDLVLSYALFSLITLVRLAFALHAWMFSIAYPLISTALAIVALRQPSTSKYALGRTPLTGLPLHLIIPAVVLVYLATATRLLLNPASAAFDYPPRSRVVVYGILILLCIVLAVMYRPRGKLRRNADLLSFSLVSVFMVGAILLTGLGLAGDVHMGNMPSITGINAAELFIWLVVLANAQSRHAGIIRPASLYLIAVIGATHLISVLFLWGSEHFKFDTADLPLIAITIGLAFLVVTVVMAVMAIMLYSSRTSGSAIAAPAAARPIASPPIQASGPSAPTSSSHSTAPSLASATTIAAATPACITMASDEAAIERIQDTFGLSKRETDTLRLAYRNKSAKEIAETLFVAESTANSHIKGIYRKCDVHSRQELIALVRRFRREPQ